jgi:hypothetical protein
VTVHLQEVLVRKPRAWEQLHAANAGEADCLPGFSVVPRRRQIVIASTEAHDAAECRVHFEGQKALDEVVPGRLDERLESARALVERD